MQGNCELLKGKVANFEQKLKEKTVRTDGTKSTEVEKELVVNSGNKIHTRNHDFVNNIGEITLQSVSNPTEGKSHQVCPWAPGHQGFNRPGPAIAISRERDLKNPLKPLRKRRRGPAHDSNHKLPVEQQPVGHLAWPAVNACTRPPILPPSNVYEIHHGILRNPIHTSGPPNGVHSSIPRAGFSLESPTPVPTGSKPSVAPLVTGTLGDRLRSPNVADLARTFEKAKKPTSAGRTNKEKGRRDQSTCT
ncbi:hypothetical protein JTB14_038130 [Gonioctena quinquepunctata]|nr:hypothetical protein JTB14_038130 [Gonioctena quinquepunctata]